MNRDSRYTPCITWLHALLVTDREAIAWISAVQEIQSIKGRASVTLRRTCAREVAGSNTGPYRSACLDLFVAHPRFCRGCRNGIARILYVWHPTAIPGQQWGNTNRQSQLCSHYLIATVTDDPWIEVSCPHRGVRTRGGCYFYGNICCGEGFGLLLAKGCDRIAALTTCKQKHALQLSAITLNCGHVLWFDKESGPKAKPNWVLGKVTEKWPRK